MGLIRGGLKFFLVVGHIPPFEIVLLITYFVMLQIQAIGYFRNEMPYFVD